MKQSQAEMERNQLASLLVEATDQLDHELVMNRELLAALTALAGWHSNPGSLAQLDQYRETAVTVIAKATGSPTVSTIRRSSEEFSAETTIEGTLTDTGEEVTA